MAQRVWTRNIRITPFSSSVDILAIDSMAGGCCCWTVGAQKLEIS